MMATKAEEKEYNSYSDMIRDLRERTKSEDPRVAEEAKDILAELWKNLFKGALKQPSEEGREKDNTFLFR
jgi:predicted CopG family antitoxin